MVGLELPVLAMEHMYLLTEPMPEVAEFNARDRARDGRGHRPSRARSTPARSAAGCCSAPTRRTAGPGRRRHALGLRPRAAAARPRPHRAVARGRLPALPGAGERRHQAGDQRPLHLRAGRQPAGRAGAGADQLLGRLRGDGGLQPGRRRRAGARELDDGGRSRARRLRHGRGALRRVGDACATPTPRCARTTRGASRSASPTRSWPRRGRSRRRRSTTSRRARTTR